jgi:endonuclease/exonuclease/phosphatase family metal-dependent hydrolase
MKILTLNLWNGGRLFDAALSFLQTEHADVMFLQEVYDGHDLGFEERFRTVDILKTTFPDHYAFFAPAYRDVREKEGEIEDGQLILSRWPITQTESLFLDVPYGKYDQDGSTDFSQFPALVQKAVMDCKGKKITLLNVHGPVNYNGDEDDERRLHLRDIILNNITEYTIATGDFNMWPTTQTIQTIEQKLNNVFAGEFTTTFNLSRKDLVRFPGYASSVVDMMFVSPGFSVVSKAAPQVDVSDHLPLVVEVDFTVF